MARGEYVRGTNGAIVFINQLFEDEMGDIVAGDFTGGNPLQIGDHTVSPGERAIGQKSRAHDNPVYTRALTTVSSRSLSAYMFKQ